MKGSKKTPAAGESSHLTFEQALHRLEKIVADMEAADLPLEDVLKRYEEGTRLVRFCSAKLDEAEKKIEILQKKPNGSIQLTPLTGTETTEEPESEGKLL